jgi:hypothetical protein
MRKSLPIAYKVTFLITLHCFFAIFLLHNMIIVKDIWVEGIKKMEGEKNGKKRKAEEMVDEEREDDDQVKMMKLPDGRRYCGK